MLRNECQRGVLKNFPVPSLMGFDGLGLKGGELTDPIGAPSGVIDEIGKDEAGAFMRGRAGGDGDEDDEEGEEGGVEGDVGDGGEGFGVAVEEVGEEICELVG